MGASNRVTPSLTIGNVPGTVDAYGKPLQDKCSICLRHADVVALDQALSKQNSLVVRDLAVAAPSRADLPTLVEGGAAAGNYTVYLELVNWLNIRGRYVICTRTCMCVRYVQVLAYDACMCLRIFFCFLQQR